MFLEYIWLAWTGIMLGRLSGPMMVTPCSMTIFARHGQFAVAARLGRQIDDDRAGPHAPRPSRPVIRRGAGRPGTSGGGDDHVRAGGVVGQHFLLPAHAARRRASLRVAAGRPASRRAGVDLDELGAQALDLLLDDRARVERLDHRAEAARGGDRLQAGHAGAEHQHLAPARSCRPRSSAAGRTSAACRPRAAPPCSRRRCSCEERASIDCARVMRGMASMLKLVTPAAASALTSSWLTSGEKKRSAPCSGRSSATSSRDGRATLRIRSAPAEDAGRVGHNRRAGLGVGVVDERCARPGARLHQHACPAATYFLTASGISATRVSLATVSVGTPSVSRPTLGAGAASSCNPVPPPCSSRRFARPNWPTRPLDPPCGNLAIRAPGPLLSLCTPSATARS